MISMVVYENSRVFLTNLVRGNVNSILKLVLYEINVNFTVVQEF